MKSHWKRQWLEFYPLNKSTNAKKPTALENSEQKKTDRIVVQENLQKSAHFFLGAWDAADETVQAGAIGVDLQLMGGTGEGSYHFDQRHAHGACAVLSFLFEGHVA